MAVGEQYDFWLVDLDGTVVDVEWPYVRGVFDRVGERLDRSFSDRQAEVLWNGLSGSRDEQLRQWEIDPAAFWSVFHDVEDPRERADYTYVHDDSRFIAQLDVPVGLVTHCQDFLTEPVLDRTEIHEWFDAVVCCSDSIGWKPDPAPVKLAMERLGVGDNGNRGVLVGDGANDVGAAWNAGIDAIHIERLGHDRRGLCVLGDRRINSFDELTPDVATGTLEG